MKRFARTNSEVDALISDRPAYRPRIEELERDPRELPSRERRHVAHTSLINFLDGCALSLPIQPPERRRSDEVVGSPERTNAFSPQGWIAAALAYQGPVLVDTR